MQEDKKEAPAAALPAGGKPPSGFCDRLQRAFHARPAFRPLRRLAVRHQEDGTATVKPAADAAGAGATRPVDQPAHKHGGPPAPVPAPPRPLTSPPPPAGGVVPAPTAPRRPLQPAPPVRLPAVTTTTTDAAKKAAGSSGMPAGLPVPVPPPDVLTSRATAADEKAGDKAQQANGKNRAGFGVFKALSSK